ncbi:MAG: site-specific integrase [Spirochaetota bacterium]|nr:site-specific integrase [Spirochaetota bacterium]
MGIYKRENGIYYLNKTINKRTYRLSLETKNYHEAKERYEMFCSKLFYNKVHNMSEIPLIMRESAFKSSKDHLGSMQTAQTKNINRVYQDYLKIAKYNGITEETIKVKEVGLIVLKQYNLEWNTINNDTMLEIQTDLRQKYSKHYAYKITKNIRAFLNYAIKQGYYDYNEYKKLEFFQAPKPQKRKVIISMDDFKDMLLYCDRVGNLDFKYYLMTLFFTGSRPREIVNLTYKDIDLKNNRISIWMNKTKKFKTVPLNPMFARELVNIIKFNELTNGCLFIGSIKSDKGFYSRQFKIMKEELNLNSDYSLYLFRHTSGSLALEISKDIHKVKALLGHESIKTTDQYYMLENPESLRDTQDELVHMVYK